jgi:predicted small lipoprotein YifL
MHAHILYALIAGTALLLSACGNKGSLVLPPKPVPAQEKVAKPPAAADHNSAAPAAKQ